MVEQLRGLREQIPDYVQLSVAKARAILPLAILNAEFAQAAINAVGASPAVQNLIGRTPQELQSESETSARWSAVEDELRALLQGVASANLTRRHRLGEAALLTYAVSKKLVKAPEHAVLLPHLAQMRKANRLGRGGKQKQSAPPTVPAPKPSPTPATTHV
jgi:hypothetical protein